MLLREKVAAFDMDGTMIDSMPCWRYAYREFLDECGLPVPELFRHESAEKMYAQRACDLVYETYGARLHMSREQIWEGLLAQVTRHYARDVQLRPGVLEYLDALRAQGVRVGVATATREDMARVALERLDLARRLDFGYFGEEIPKWNPEYFRRLAREQGARPDQCAMFEDAAYSMRGAREAGFHVYAIEDSFAALDRAEILTLCDRYFTDFNELMSEENER